MFKPGDVVIITEPDDHTDGPGFVDGMEEYCDIPMMIESETSGHTDDGGWYHVAGGGGYFWAGNWMKKVNKFKGNK